MTKEEIILKNIPFDAGRLKTGFISCNIDVMYKIMEEYANYKLNSANDRIKEMESAIKKYEDELGYNKQRPDGMNGKF